MKIFLKYNPLFSFPFKYLQFKKDKPFSISHSFSSKLFWKFQPFLKIATYNELILQLEKGCVTLKEADTAGMETMNYAPKTLGFFPHIWAWISPGFYKQEFQRLIGLVCSEGGSALVSFRASVHRDTQGGGCVRRGQEYMSTGMRDPYFVE